MDSFSTFLALPIILEIYKDLLQPSIRTGGEALNQRVKKALNDANILSADQQVEQANTQVSIPTLETLSYVNDEYLQNCFLKLLATSYDKDKQNIAHPAFPQILAQLSRDEAMILAHFKKGKLIQDFKPTPLEVTPAAINKTVTEKAEITDSLFFKSNFELYMDHLTTLNLLQKTQFNTYPLTEFGKMFVEACIPDDLDIEKFDYLRKYQSKDQ